MNKLGQRQTYRWNEQTSGSSALRKESWHVRNCRRMTEERLCEVLTFPHPQKQNRYDSSFSKSDTFVSIIAIAITVLAIGLSPLFFRLLL